MIFKRIISLLLLLSIGLPIAKPLFQSLTSQQFSEDFWIEKKEEANPFSYIIWELIDAEEQEEEDSENDFKKVQIHRGLLQNSPKVDLAERSTVNTCSIVFFYREKLYLFHGEMLI
ncbi:hypothetical protein [Jiulongibacter sediminis]|uniref:Uncharacterized protein n=1 Tax=Jiulongibacter sediminis TaxID=1605367 RepID=A0A0P7BX12_9BACT|nr:hypothetical protein [Jiulongibacter sediminis]KPM49471.1 hypothetical protein AFM12_02360 [Jiulongibacter sediminis]TBX26519.1 hypothetical protein TK44_02365 [Jiulongibacter sediminis]